MPDSRRLVHFTMAHIVVDLSLHIHSLIHLSFVYRRHTVIPERKTSFFFKYMAIDAKSYIQKGAHKTRLLLQVHLLPVACSLTSRIACMLINIVWPGTENWSIIVTICREGSPWPVADKTD